MPDIRPIVDVGHGYRHEFPDFPPEDMPVIPEGFTDVSWHNDMNPSFLKSLGKIEDVDIDLILHVDYADPAKREEPDFRRFYLAKMRDGMDVIADFDTDDWQAMLLTINVWSVIHPAVSAREEAVHEAIDLLDQGFSIDDAENIVLNSFPAVDAAAVMQAAIDEISLRSHASQQGGRG